LLIVQHENGGSMAGYLLADQQRRTRGPGVSTPLLRR
jgi:hypothetical protein